MKCMICPRQCGVDRATQNGICGVGDQPRIARAALHFWEEPCISGTRGSGTVFFSGCPLKCCFCQNHEISAGAAGKDVTVERLSEIYLELQAQGAHNINLVSPTHYTAQAAESLRFAKDQGLSLPVVWNSSGYESPSSLALVEGLIDIYMPDIKYRDAMRSQRYSKSANYFEVASKAVLEMYRQAGPAEFDDSGMLKKGLVVRHLVLPGGVTDSCSILDWMAENLDKENIVVSLMSQYTPCHESTDYPEINRKLTTLEYSRVLKHYNKLDFKYGYCQQRTSAKEEYVPPFNLDGV